MPKRSAQPKPAIEVNPQFATRRGVEVVEDRRETTTPTQILPGITAVNSEALNRQLDELAELLRNALLMPRAEGPLRDALARVATLRKTLGL